MKADFYTEVYNIVKEIPEGNVVTYGQLAKLARRPQCSRMVGQAMFNAPRELNLPCHRVVNSQGRLAPNWTEQRELLEKEPSYIMYGGNIHDAGRIGKNESLSTYLQSGLGDQAQTRRSFVFPYHPFDRGTTIRNQTGFFPG